MTFRKFWKKLEPVFTQEEIMKLRKFGIDCCEDVFEEPIRKNDTIALDHVYSMIWDEASSLEDFNNMFSGIIGKDLSQEKFNALLQILDADVEK